MVEELWGFLDQCESGCQIGWSLEINDGTERAMIGGTGGTSLVGWGNSQKKSEKRRVRETITDRDGRSGR